MKFNNLPNVYIEGHTRVGGVRVGEVYNTNEGGTVTVMESLNSKTIKVKHNDRMGHEVITTPSHVTSGRLKNPYRPSVHGRGYMGVGIYQASVGGVKTIEYKIWSGILERCYSSSYCYTHETYKDCTVCDEWLNFQNFAKWYRNNEDYGKGYDIDKDILVKNNKVYSPATCILVPSVINKMLIGRDSSNRMLPTGVYTNNNKTKYVAKFRVNGDSIFIGTYDTIEEARIAYNTAKETHVKNVANLWKDKISSTTYNALINWTV